MNNEIIIKKNTSIYKGHKIYDMSIMKLVGNQTYCYLYNNAPQLYTAPLNCAKNELPIQLDVIILESNLTPEKIKEQLCAIVSNDEAEVNPIVLGMKLSSPYDDNNNIMKIYWDLVYIFLFLLLIF